MEADLTRESLHDLIARLREDSEAIAWTERRSIPWALVVVLQDARPAADAAAASELVELLASDAKWEVRKAVADALRRIPDEVFTKTLVRLCDDDNTFVRRAAESALDRRRAAPASTAVGCRDVPSVAGKLAQLEQRHGIEAARLARQIGETYYDQLVSATAHDARGILTPLASKLDRMIDQLGTKPGQSGRLKRSLEGVRDRVILLTRLIEDMQSYSLPVPPARRPQRLADILAEAERIARDAVDGRRYQIDEIMVQQAVDGSITVEVARDRVLMAFANVIKNALESFAPDRTVGVRSVQITARVVEDGIVQVTVQDNGVGMSSDDLAQVREFLPGAKTKKNEGMGFGLPIARRSIVAHGGSLTIESGEGHGTTVTITLSLEQGAGEA